MMLSKFQIRWWHPLAVLVAVAAFLLLPKPALSMASAEPPAPVLIIDAGHGGADGGAVASDGALESDINLDIALRLEALARFWGVDTVLTRRSADIDYPEGAESISAKKKADQNARIALINDTPGGLLLSIHQNNYPASSPSGIQVFYGGEEGSDIFAEVLQGNLTAQLCPENRRMAGPIDNGIYLMRKAKCPAVLVECGFLSNPGELQKLESPNYRMSLAAVMLASYLQYTKGITL